jgi:hypothetical protein
MFLDATWFASMLVNIFSSPIVEGTTVTFRFVSRSLLSVPSSQARDLLSFASMP